MQTSVRALEHWRSSWTTPPPGAPAGESAGSSDSQSLRLSDLEPGHVAEVVALEPECRGLVRHRLLDLGFTPGARVRLALTTFAGDPRAYHVRGTTIALRREQSARVLVRAVA